MGHLCAKARVVYSPSPSIALTKHWWGSGVSKQTDILRCVCAGRGCAGGGCVGVGASVGV